MSNSTDILIFLGPTLPLAEAQSVLNATYLPPAKQGDILSASNYLKPKAIGLIDGFFMQTLSVWHKEILYALDEGIAVFGASSMGALRAAETAECGMIGIGKIYELYKSGKVIDDDEVVLAHGPAEEGYFPLSLPLINLRFTFDQAKETKALPQELCDSFFHIIQSLYYPDRTFQQIEKEARKKGIEEKDIRSVINHLQSHYVDQKKEDALLLLEAIKSFSPPVSKPFAKTIFFEGLYHYDRKVQIAPLELSTKNIAHYVALHHPDFPLLQYHALNQSLITLLASILKIEVSEDAINQEKERFCFRLKLSTEEDLKQWLMRNHLKLQEFHELMQKKAEARFLHNSFTLHGVVAWKRFKLLLDELKINGEYETWLEKAACQEEILAKAAPHHEELEHPELLDKKIVENHALETSWNPDIPCKQWAEEAGFSNLSELKAEMLKAKIARDYLENILF